MYKIVTKEDTIRIPAEYMRKGASLNDHIDRLSMTAFEGRFDDDNRFILVTSNHEPLGRGRIIHGDGAIYQRVRFDAVLFLTNGSIFKKIHKKIKLKKPKIILDPFNYYNS